MAAGAEKWSGKRLILIILVLLSLYLVLRLFALGKPLTWEDQVRLLSSQRISGEVFSHTIFSDIFSQLVFGLWGVSSFNARIVPFISLIASFLIFLRFLRDNYDIKTAVLALLIFTFSTWHVFYSTTKCVPNEFATVFILLGLLYFSRYLKKGRRRDLFLSGMFMGFASISYEPTLVYFAPFIPFLIVTKEKRKLKELMGECLVLLMGLFSVIIVYVLLNLLFFDGKSLLILVKWGLLDKANFYSGGIMYIYYHIYSFLRILIYAGPLLLSGIAYFILKKENRQLKRDNLSLVLMLVCLSGIMFFVIVVPPANHQVRYLGPIVPLFCVFASSMIISWGLSKRRVAKALIVGILLFFALFCINKAGVMANVKDYARIGIIQNLQTYFISVHPNDTGTTITNGILLAVFLLGTVLFMMTLLCKGSWRKAATVIAIGLFLAFNIFTLQEYLFHLSGINFDRAHLAVEGYLKENKPDEDIYMNLEPSVFTEAYGLKNNISFRELVSITYKNVLAGKNNELVAIGPEVSSRIGKMHLVADYELANLSSTGRSEFFAKLKEEKAFIILINNYLYYDEDSELIGWIKANCRERETTRTRTVLTSLVYQC